MYGTWALNIHTYLAYSTQITRQYICMYTVTLNETEKDTYPKLIVPMLLVDWCVFY